MRIAIAVMSIFVQGCGTGDGGGENASSQPQITSRVVANLADIPTCEDALEGALVYVKESEGFKYCEAGQWADIVVAPASPHFTTLLLCTSAPEDSPSGAQLLEFAVWSSEINERYLMFRVNGETKNSMILGPGTNWGGTFAAGLWEVVLDDKTATFTKGTETHTAECSEVDQMTGKLAKD